MDANNSFSVLVQLQDQRDFRKAYDTWQETLGCRSYMYPPESAGRLRNGKIEGVTYSCVPEPFLRFLDSKGFSYEVL